MASFGERDTTVMYRESGPWPPSVTIAYESSEGDNPGTFPGTGPIPNVPTFKAWLNCPIDSAEQWPVVETKLGLIDAFTAMVAATLFQAIEASRDA